MKKKRLPKSIRRHLRAEKARIRQEVLDLKKQEKLINELYEKFNKEDNKLSKIKTAKQASQHESK